jgi:hypothetical protein
MIELAAADGYLRPRTYTMKKSTPPKVVKFSAAKQRRLDDLLDKNAEGTITPREKAVLEKLVAEAERLIVANAERLASYSQAEGSPPAAVPVTVWVQAEQVQR